MTNIVYMTEKQEQQTRLDIESNLASLFRERVETKGKQVRSFSRTIALWVTLALSTWFLADMGLEIYQQQLLSESFLIRFVVSALNLLIFLGGFSVVYIVTYNFTKTVVGFNLFSRGEYYERKDSTYLPLFEKLDKGYYVDMYFQSNGYVSKVSVPSHYASRFEIGDLVPVEVVVLMYKQSGKVRVVTNCVGSRANDEQEFQETLWRHGGNLKTNSSAYFKALASHSSELKQISMK